MFRRVEMKVVAAQIGYMHQSLDVHVVERNKNPKPHHRTDGAVECLADAIAHVIALEPRLDIARRLVGTALRLRAMHAEFLPVAGIVALVVQHSLDRAVHKQVRIAPDG